MAMHGGTDGGGNARSDLWVLGLQPATWRRVAGAALPARSGHAMGVARGATAVLFEARCNWHDQNFVFCEPSCGLLWICCKPRRGETAVLFEACCCGDCHFCLLTAFVCLT